MKVCLLLGILEEPADVVESMIVEPGCGVFTYVVAETNDFTMGFFLAGVLN